MSAAEGSTPKRVSIIGGGAAGVATAFALSDTPELRERYEVTLYTLGWRLGGKCASGRNPDFGQRVEEHGLHIWFGFYDNAFAMMQRVYDELDRPQGAPLRGWRDAFKPANEVLLCERWKGEWVRHRFETPENPLTPGEPIELSLWHALHAAVGLLHGLWRRAAAELDAEVLSGAPHRAGRDALALLARIERRAIGALEHAGVGAEHELLEIAHRLTAAQAGKEEGLEHLPLLCRLLAHFRDWLWRDVVEPRSDDPRLRLTFMSVDFVAATITGMIEDELLHDGFAQINDEELRGWLARHGISQLTLDQAPFLRGYYDLAFAYENGDTTRPNLAAGKALQDFIRIAFTYKGAMLWKMQVGMGDAVFAPLYELLRARGVQVCFFERADRVRLSGNLRAVEAIELTRQARVRDGAYDWDPGAGAPPWPLVEVHGLACWSSAPDWSALEDGEALRAAGANFEDPGCAPAADSFELRCGEHFDVAVIAVSAASLEPLCGELRQHERFREMLEHTHTVATQAFQLWLNRPLEELGWTHGEAILSSYVEPLDTYSTMNQLLACEDWPESEQVCNVAYFCGPLRSLDGETLAAAQARVRESALRFMRTDAGYLWPAAADGAFDWTALADPRGRSGEQRFDAQYWRANVIGSERYVTTHAGTVAYRLAPHESGCENLLLAGDWTRNGIDGGSVEAAVTSGLLAARAICGSPAQVPGTSGWLAGDAYTPREQLR